jgi:hypothetical protein
MFGNPPPASQPVYQRQALGLPAGSIRAILALGVLGLLWLFVWQYNEQQRPPLEFIYLEYLMLLILASYFTAHGKTIGTQVSRRSPLGLPSGVVRVVLIAGYLGLAAYMWYYNRYQFDQEITAQPLVLVPLLLLCTFFLGHICTGIVRWVSGAVLPPAYQDIQAWLALLALLLMAGLAMFHLFIRPTLTTPYDVPVAVEATLAAIVGFYFGARS